VIFDLRLNMVWGKGKTVGSAQAFSSPGGERWSRPPPVIGLTLKPLKPGQPPKPCSVDFPAARRGKQWWKRVFGKDHRN
jgi:hypothetical protein